MYQRVRINPQKKAEYKTTGCFNIIFIWLVLSIKCCILIIRTILYMFSNSESGEAVDVACTNH